MLSENIILFAICAIVFVPLIIVGIVLLTGRGASLIAGYNTASQAEKARWNEKRLCRATGAMVLCFTLLLCTCILSAVLGSAVVAAAAGACAALVIIGGLVYIHRSGRFKNQ